MGFRVLASRLNEPLVALQLSLFWPGSSGRRLDGLRPLRQQAVGGNVGGFRASERAQESPVVMGSRRAGQQAFRASSASSLNGRSAGAVPERRPCLGRLCSPKPARAGRRPQVSRTMGLNPTMSALRCAIYRGWRTKAPGEKVLGPAGHSRRQVAHQARDRVPWSCASTFAVMRLPSNAVVAGLIVALGAGLIFAGWRLDSRQYLSSLMLELGVTALILLPLLWIERLFERRVEATAEETREQVSGVAQELTAVSQRLEETQQGLSDLRGQMTERLQAAADADSLLVRRARENVSLESVIALLKRAEELGAVSARGLRVVVPGQWERLRFRLVTEVESTGVGAEPLPAMWLSVEGSTGVDTPIQALWRPDDGAVDALLTLAEAWKRSGSYPGDHALDAEWIFERLITSLDIAIQGRRTRGDRQLHPLIELLSVHWAMTDYGLEHVPDFYVIRGTELASEDGLAHWRQHMREKAWVEEEDIVARDSRDADFWMVSEVAHSYFAVRESGDQES